MSRTRTRTAAVTTTAAAGALGLALLSACSGSYGSSSHGSAAGGPTATSPAATSSPQAAQQAAGTRLTAATVGGLGQVVTDRSGMTLYRFDQDTANPPATHCAGQCAVKWPPALVTGSGTVTLKGVDKSLVGTVTRPDGSKQLTLHGWPLYRFANDAAPGDAKGQGVGGTWFAATPQGAKATTHAPTSKDSASSYGDDYGY
jgi:predicted lipoprotein with Yx(FWY)xxD motif